MYNFTLQMPTRIHFGKGQISHLSELTARFCSCMAAEASSGMASMMLP